MIFLSVTWNILEISSEVALLRQKPTMYAHTMPLNIIMMAQTLDKAGDLTLDLKDRKAWGNPQGIENKMILWYDIIWYHDTSSN